MDRIDMLADGITEEAMREFGVAALSAAQAEVIGALMRGRDAMAILATGKGKSICYQLPAVNLPGMALIISPLISLMEDQVRQMKAMGIAAERLHSGMNEDALAQILRRIAAGELKMLYLSPERLVRGGALVEAMGSRAISLVAVDEAHCVSMWGNDFRRDYLRIRDAIAVLERRQGRRPVVMAATATAPRDVERDIRLKLSLDHPVVVRGSIRRENLRLAVHVGHDRKRILAREIRRHRDALPAIVYCATVKAVMSVRDHLIGEGVFAAAYHGQMAAEQRRDAQDDFMAGRLPVMVATGAFGMGVNKSDIRAIYHYQMPRDLSTYYQEIGRAGRDGLPALATLLCNERDVGLHEFMIRAAWPARNDILSAIQVMTYLERQGFYGQYAAGQLRALCREAARLHPNALSELDMRRIVFFLSDMGGATIYRTGPGPNGEAVTLNEYDETRMRTILDTVDTMRARSLSKVAEMWRYASDEATCRQKLLVRALGDGEDGESCGICDTCLSPTAIPDRPRRQASAPADPAMPSAVEQVRQAVAKLAEKHRCPPFAIASPLAIRSLAKRVAREGVTPREQSPAGRLTDGIAGIANRYRDALEAALNDRGEPRKAPLSPV